MNEHVTVRRLLDAAHEQVPLTPDERAHLRKCEECLDLFVLFARQNFYPQNIKGKDTAA